MTFAAAIFLIVAGAILKYATHFEIAGVEEGTVGLILILAGVTGLIFGLIETAAWSRRGRVVEDDRGYRT